MGTWSSPGVSPVTQTITVTDSGVRATVTAPNDVTISCVESSDPANTGTATAIGDCSVPSVTFVDSITNNCDEDTCSNTETITSTSCDVGPVTCPDPIVIDDACPDYEDDDFVRYSSYNDGDDDRLGNRIDDDDVCNCRAASS